MLFTALWAVCKPLMDSKTVAKVKFIRGDVSEGSENDKILKEIVGEEWRKMCDNTKDAYKHGEFWPSVLQDELNWNARHPKRDAAAPVVSVVAAEPAAAAAAAVPAEPAAEGTVRS